MTNAHVVDGADEVLVTLTDKREFKAKIIGADKRTDVAVVKIEATGLPVVKIGDSRQAEGRRMGDGDRLAVRAGEHRHRRHRQRQAARHRRLPAVHPDRRGHQPRQLRRAADQHARRGGGHQQPDLLAAPAASWASRSRFRSTRRSACREQLRASGRVSRGRIGVQIDQVTKDVAESIGLGKPQGALVRSVEAGGPADKAGVEAGDIITKFDGKVVDKSSDLPRLVGNTKPGSKTTLHGVPPRQHARTSSSPSASSRPTSPVRKAGATSTPRRRRRRVRSGWLWRPDRGAEEGAASSRAA